MIAFQIPANYPSPGELVVFDEAAAKWQRQPVARLRASYESDSEPPIAHPPFESYVVVEQSLASDHEGVSGPSIDEDKFVNRFDTVARRHIERSKCILALIDMLVDEHITPGPKKILKNLSRSACRAVCWELIITMDRDIFEALYLGRLPYKDNAATNQQLHDALQMHRAHTAELQDSHQNHDAIYGNWVISSERQSLTACDALQVIEGSEERRLCY